MNEQQRDHLPDDARTHTFVVYDDKTGDLVHGHKAVVLPYGDAPDEKQLMEEALSFAAEVSGRKNGLRVLAVSEDELEPGSVYRVDPESERLEKTEVEGAA